MISAFPSYQINISLLKILLIASRAIIWCEIANYVVMIVWFIRHFSTMLTTFMSLRFKAFSKILPINAFIKYCKEWWAHSPRIMKNRQMIMFHSLVIVFILFTTMNPLNVHNVNFFIISNLHINVKNIIYIK